MTTCKYCHLQGHTIDKCPTIVCRVCKAIGHPGWSCTASSSSSGSKPRSRGRGRGAAAPVEAQAPAPVAKIYSFESTGSMASPSPRSSTGTGAGALPLSEREDHRFRRGGGGKAPTGDNSPTGSTAASQGVEQSTKVGDSHERCSLDVAATSGAKRVSAVLPERGARRGDDSSKRSAESAATLRTSGARRGDLRGFKARNHLQSGNGTTGGAIPPSAIPARETINLLYYTRMADLRWADL